MTDKINYAILSYLLVNTSIYTKYINYININTYKESNKLLYKFFVTLKQLKEKVPKDSHSLEELVLLFNTEYPVLSKDEKALLPRFIEDLYNVEALTDESVLLGYLQSLYERQLGEKLAIKALDFSQGRVDKSEIEVLTKELFDTNVKTAVEVPYVECDLNLAVNHITVPGLRWRLKVLNQSLGSLRKGNMGFIFARPETGKTTFLASEVTYFAEQTEGNILWVNNEQPIPEVMLRCYCASLGKDKDVIFKDLDAAKREFAEKVGNRIKFIDTDKANKRDVESVCKELNPVLIIFDQLDKITGDFGDERNDLVLKAKYQWARELSKVYGPVIGVCQAGGTAENKKYLVMTDVDSSHTAKQGEADWMLGIGMTNFESDEFVRYLSICKNKLPGDPDTVKEMRHAKMMVGINPFIARYEG